MYYSHLESSISQCPAALPLWQSHAKVKVLPKSMHHKLVLISDSMTLSQTPAKIITGPYKRGTHGLPVYLPAYTGTKLYCLVHE